MITFRYRGLARTVQPHIYGINTLGHEALSAYQTGGFSQSSHRPGWRMFLVSDIEDLVVEDKTFKRTREDYNPDDPNFTQILSRA